MRGTGEVQGEGGMSERSVEYGWALCRVHPMDTPRNLDATCPSGRVVSIWRKEKVFALGGEPKGTCE
jgi:hypothetical protein